MKKVIAAAALALTMSAGLAAADNVVTNVEGEVGSVLIRDGQILELVSGTQLVTGDRIISAEGSVLTLSNGECERTFSDANAIAFNDDFCDTSVDSTLATGGDTELGLAGGTSGGLIALLAAAAVVTTVVVVADDDDNADVPVSP